MYTPTEPSCVDCGTPGALHATFLIPNGVSVFGGFRGNVDPNDPNDFGETFLIQRDELVNVTILSGDVNNDSDIDPPDFTDDVYHVVTFFNTFTETTKLSGFTIRRGNADGPSVSTPVQYDRIGGGILIAGTRIGSTDGQSSPRITRCKIESCTADLFGGGIAATWSDVPTNPSLRVPPRIVNCTLFENLVFTDLDDDPNEVTAGGGFAAIAAPYEVTNCVIYSNDADLGGGALVSELLPDPNASPIIAPGKFTNCTFYLNKGAPGGAIYANTDPTRPALVRNSICWEDGTEEPNNPVDELFGSLDVSHSDIQFFSGTYPSVSDPNSNINEDPNFCSTSESNNIYQFVLMVNENSPVVDLGNDPNVPADNADVDDDGNTTETIEWDRGKRPRQFDSISQSPNLIVDMGAYEVRRVDSCREDINRDGVVNGSDLSLLLAVFGTSFSTCPYHPADIDRDGAVGLSDLAMLLTVFGTSCGSSLMMSGGEFDGDPELVWFDQFSNTPTPEFVDWARQATIEELQNWLAWYVGGGNQEY